MNHYDEFFIKESITEGYDSRLFPDGKHALVRHYDKLTQRSTALSVVDVNKDSSVGEFIYFELPEEMMYYEITETFNNRIKMITNDLFAILGSKNVTTIHRI